MLTYIPNCSVFDPGKIGVLYVTVLKYSLRNFSVITLRSYPSQHSVTLAESTPAIRVVNYPEM